MIEAVLKKNVKPGYIYKNIFASIQSCTSRHILNWVWQSGMCLKAVVQALTNPTTELENFLFWTFNGRLHYYLESFSLHHHLSRDDSLL